jgi:hypothetical protein
MSSKAFTRQIFDWLHQVNTDDDLTPADVCVALQLTRHFNEDDDGGRAWPSCKFIGDEIGLSESTVINSVRRLHKHGHLRVVWGQRGRGHPNQYWMEIKPQRAKVLDDVKHQPVKVLTPQSTRIKPQPAKENHLKNQGEGGGPGRPSLAAAPQLLLLEIYNRGHLKDAAALPAVRTAFHAAGSLRSTILVFCRRCRTGLLLAAGRNHHQRNIAMVTAASAMLASKCGSVRAFNKTKTATGMTLLRSGVANERDRSSPAAATS